MKVDINYASSALPDNAQTRSTGRKAELQGREPAEVQQKGATARVPPAARLSKGAGVSRSAGVSDTAVVYNSDRIDKLGTLVHSSPDVRRARVQALQDAISQGTYQASAERIADAMLAQATSKLR